ncbi:MAG: hypothetical protein V7K69_00400 [Nostoc sp.]|uniref:hypothetical protein n=1 Tax=Nostoc sp. TaxID=1180 RepID=UPI002FF9C811
MGIFEAIAFEEMDKGWISSGRLSLTSKTAKSSSLFVVILNSLPSRHICTRFDGGKLKNST